MSAADMLRRLLVVFVLGVASPAIAQEKVPVDSVSDLVVAMDVDSLDQVLYPPFGPGLGLHSLGYRYSIPFRSSGYVGVGRVTGLGGGLIEFTGVTLELGSGGGQVGLTHGRFNGHIALAFVRAQIVAGRTWGDPHVVAAGRDFVGIEARAGSMLLFNLSLGFMWRVDGGPGQRWFIPVGWQFGN